MSFLTSRTSMAFRASAMRMQLRSPSSRAFSMSLSRAAMSEGDTHRHDRKDEIDSHKNESVGKAKDGKGEWKKELASNSEAAIKADRGEIDASKDSIKKLEKETQEILGNKK